MDDIIGGRVIIPTTSILRNTSLPGLKPATTPTEWSAVPNAYKTVFSVLYDTISESFYSEDLVAKRLSITFNSSNEGELRLDGTLIATSDPQAANSWNSVLLTIEHPYGATWADQSFWQTVWAGKPYLVANAWGNTTKEMAIYHQGRLRDNMYAGGAADDENVICESLSVIWHTWAANKSIMASMIGRMNMCTTVLHHQVGLVGHYDAPFTDLGGIMWSSSALDNDYNRIYATDTMLALRGVGFESASVQQTSKVPGVSSDTVIGVANTAGQKIFHADSTNWSTDVRPNLVNYTTQTLDDIENWYINYGWKIIIHEDGASVQNDYNGYGFFAVGQYGGAVGLINGYLNGCTASFAQTTDETNSNVATPVTTNILDEQNSNRYKYGPDMTYGGTEMEHIVDGFSGEFKYRHTDISIGSGPYPQSLHYMRSFDNRRRTEFNEVGYGWRHNYQITAHLSSDGYDALGEQAASNAAPNLIDLMVGILNFQNGFYGPGFTLVSLANLYAQRAVTSNVVTIRDGENVYKFSQLMGLNGGFLGPKGTGLGLTYQTSGALLMQNVAGDKWYFNLQNFIDRIEYASGITVTFTYTGLFPRLTSVSNNLGLSLNFTYGNVAGVIWYITKVTDSAFREVEYDFDSGLKLKEYYDALNQKTEYFYDSKGRMEEYKFPNLYSVINEFDDLDRVVQQTNPGSQISTFKYLGNQTIVLRGTRVINTYYNPDGKPRMVIDGLETTQFTYDGLGRKIHEWQSSGPTTSWQYDNLNRVLVKTQTPGAGGGSVITESWTYGTIQDMWVTYTDPLGGVHYRTINAKNLVDDETGPAVGGVNPVKTWTYDGYGRVTSYEDPTGVVTEYNYGSMNTGPHLTSQVYDSGGLDLTTTYGYDSVGNKTSVTNPRGYASTYTWDVLRRPLSKTATSPFSYVTEWTYDTQGNVLTQRRSLGAGWQTETRTYSPLNKVLTITDPRSKVTTNTYDSYGRLATTTDAESRVTQFFYDNSNRLTSVIDANSVTAEQRTYTDSGQLYQLTDARSNVSTYTYDGHDRKKRCTYPDSSYEEWTYDAAGNVTTFRSRSSDTITSTFDALNRLATRTPQGQATETFTYDLAGRLLSASTPTVSGNPATGTFSRGYDSAKRLTSETNPQSQVVTYELDDNGNVTKITYPDSYYVEKVYDQIDRLTTVKLNGSSSSAASYSYDDLSRRTNLTFLNGVDQDYGYDIGDNMTSMDLAWTGSSASWTYGYNDVEEMTSQAFSDTGFQWRPAAAATVNYGTANNLNQYPTVGGVTRTMNSDGCLTGDGTWTYTYDADNMLTQAAKTGVTVNFVYDPFHRNIRKDDGTNKTRYIYAGDQILCEYNDTSGALINRYVYGFEADDPIIQVTSGGTVTYNTQDHVGSIIARTDSSGGILSKYKYAPFGESPSLSGTIFGFTGQRFDAETGLYHFKARYYDPVTGRFLQPDPIGYKDGLNIYAYVRNTPLGLRDPSGTAGAEAFFEPYTEAHFQTLAAELFMVAEIMNVVETLGGSMALMPMSYSQFRTSYSASKITLAPKVPNVSEGTTAAPSFVVSKSGTTLIVPKGAKDIRPSASTHTGADNAFMYEGGTMSVPVSVNSTKMKDVPMNLRITKPSDGYPSGYGKYEKPLKNNGKQNVDPYTNKPGNPNGLGTRGLWDEKGPHFGLHE